MPLSIYSRYAALDVVEVDGVVTLVQRSPDRAIIPEPDSILHVVTGGETIDGLAKMYYGNEELWWRIADANPTLFALDWVAGDTIVIPPIQTATRVILR